MTESPAVVTLTATPRSIALSTLKSFDWGFLMPISVITPTSREVIASME